VVKPPTIFKKWGQKKQVSPCVNPLGPFSLKIVTKGGPLFLNGPKGEKNLKFNPRGLNKPQSYSFTDRVGKKKI